MDTKKKILILDDEGSILALLYEVLKGAGYEVITADNPSITAIRAYNAELIILDLHMAETDEKQGLDVLKHIWEDKENTIPVIIFSAYANFDETINEIREIERVYGYGRKLFACIGKSDGVEPLLKSVNEFFNGESVEFTN